MNTHRLTRAAAVGALYAAVTLAAAPISFGALQFRISEALCILPWLFPETSWGLFVGCFLANLLCGSGTMDLLLGPLATLLAALSTASLRKIGRTWLGCLPPILFNAIFVGVALAASSTDSAFLTAFPLFALEVGLGEAGVLFLLGLPLLTLFHNQDKEHGDVKGR